MSQISKWYPVAGVAGVAGTKRLREPLPFPVLQLPLSPVESEEPRSAMRAVRGALADRHFRVNRTDGRDMLAVHLPGDAPGLNQADLKASALFSEAHEHCNGITDRDLLEQEFSCHYASFSPLATIRSASSGKGRCSARASGVSASSQAAD
jgi:hypothetical protein